MIHESAGQDKSAALAAICALLPLPETVNREEVRNVLLAREQLASTAIGNGIAIPHPRSPIVVGVTQPLLTVAFLRQPIDFAALDGRPLHTLVERMLSVTTTVKLRGGAVLAYLAAAVAAHRQGRPAPALN